jgi:hypothetical protein
MLIVVFASTHDVQSRKMPLGFTTILISIDTMDITRLIGELQPIFKNVCASISAFLYPLNCSSEWNKNIY